MSEIQDHHETLTLKMDARGHQFHSTFHNPEAWVKADISTLSTGERFAFVIQGTFDCHWCGAYPALEPQDRAGGLMLVAKSECPIPEGVAITFDLAVPSGVLVATDDLRPVYDVELSDDAPSFSSMAGQALHSMAMAEIGCAHGCVGNSTPSIVLLEDESYEIVSFDYYEESRGVATLATICSDLWAYSLADRDDFLARGGIFDDDSMALVEVPAGTYRFEHHTSLASFDADAYPRVYANFSRVGD